VEVVGNGKLAVEAVQRTNFDLVLMDVQMPILDGLSATKAIRGLPPPTSLIPIYALSADTPGSGPLEETGLDGYIKKPIVWNVISRLVDETLAGQRQL
jgi:CheY-like chemotaxis protein